MDEPCVLELRSITKDFPGVRALDGVNLALRGGEIHGLCGENGAGKSTLMKILSGAYPHGSFDGEIVYRGRPQRFRNVKDSEKAGIRIIHQELMLVEDLTVGENIYLGAEPLTGVVRRIDCHRLYADTKTLLEENGLDIAYAEKIRTLGVGQRQMVEIAKSLAGRVEVLILDEPTSALTDRETEVLMTILRRLKARGVTCIYISHKIEEVLAIADRVTILRDGRTVETLERKDATEDRIVSLMVGRELKDRFPQRSRPPTDEMALEVENLTCFRPDLPSMKACDGISFGLRKGEVLGIAGLMGSGRTELAMSIFGEYGVGRTGTIRVGGRPVRIGSAGDAIEHGIALVTEDRKNLGLVLIHSILHNITISDLRRTAWRGVIDGREELKQGKGLFESLRIKAPSVDTVVETLSGGNQQKTVIAKWLHADPKVLILDEPTRGIDVGAKHEIYKIMNELAERGLAILMISSELPEVLGMSDRILVMRRGRVAGILDRKGADQETIMRLATGVGAPG